MTSYLVISPTLPFDRHERVLFICRLNHRRAPGPDRFGATALQHLPASGVDLVLEPVSYTHLDVYKRQNMDRPRRKWVL